MGSLAVLALCFWSTTATAQDVDAGVDAAAATATDDGGGVAVAETDSPEVERLYDAAVDALVAGAFENAARSFDEVAERTHDDGRRRAALDLAREARQRAATATPVPPPAGTPVRSDMDPWVPPPDGAQRPPRRPPRERPSEAGDGRLALLVGTTLYGLSAAGPLLPASLGIDDARGFLGLYMLVAGGSFFLPFLATRDAHVPWGATALGLTAAARGLGHGALFSLLIDAGDEQTLFASMLATSLLELGGSYAWADLSRMTAGEAHTTQLGSDVGLGLGFGLGVIAVGDDVDLEDDHGIAISALVGAAAGVAAGRLFANVRTWTWGDAEVVQTALFVGLYAGAYPMILFEVDDVRAVTSSVMVGAIAGLVAGDRLVSGRDFGTGQSLLVELGAIAGGFLGAGLGYLAFSDSDGDIDDDGVKGMLAVSLATAIGGLATTYLLLDVADESRGRPPERSADRAASIYVAPWLSPEGERGLVLGGAL